MPEGMKIRNAFVVTPEGEIEERAYDEKWSPVVSGLENLRDMLVNRKEQNGG